MNQVNGEFKGQMKQWVEHFKEQRTEDVKTEEKHHSEIIKILDTNHKDITEKFDNHKEYHKNNEHRWGVWTLFKKKPVIPVLVGVLISGALGAIGYNLKDIVKMLVAFAK